MEKLKLGQLEMLVAAVDAGSFSAAALELGCTQSRISHSIAELERIIGSRLLERSRSGCVPTDAGYRVLVKARQMLRLAGSLVQSGGEEAVISGHVRIACFRSAGVHLLPHVLEALADSHPGIRVDVNDGCPDYEDILTAVRQGMAEIGITREDPSTGLESIRLGHDNYVLALPAGLQASDPLDWRQLAGLPFIQSQNAGSSWIVEHCRAAGLPLKAARRLASDSGIMAMVARGLGFSILPHLAVFPAPPGIRLAALPIEAERHIALVTTAETARNKAVRIVLRRLRDKAGLRRTDAYRAGAIQL
ncbi:MAG TPA: LysR family transcriptional regulator [Burkholderiaceae bacterium]